MLKGKVLNISKYRLSQFLKANLFSLIGLAFLAIGIIVGLVVFNDFAFFPDILKKYFSSYISFRQNNSFLKIVFNSFLQSIYLFLIIYVFGTTLFGVVLVPVSIAFFGVFYGAAVAYLYTEFALKGVAFNAMIFLPASILLLLLLIFASRTAMIFSLHIARLTLPNLLRGDLALQFKEYSLKILLISSGGIVVGLLDGLTAISMLKFFEF